MEIISHRGYWKTANEKNETVAFERSFRMGWGTETDLRSRNGELVISHDRPTPNSISFANFISLYRQFGRPGMLALNIKEDGLQDLVLEQLSTEDKYFLFDMSVPDMRQSVRRALPCFSRLSDIEPSPAYLDKCNGLWVDSLEAPALNLSIVKNPAYAKKTLCFVSPELHGRPHLEFWSSLKQELKSLKDVILCTDIPEEAKDYFKDFLK